jgi:hypothetical protein
LLGVNQQEEKRVAVRKKGLGEVPEARLYRFFMNRKKKVKTARA